MKDNIIELNSETLFYIPDESSELLMKGVGDSAGMIEFINSQKNRTVTVFVEGPGNISKEKFKSLCIAWLALNYPDVLNYDDYINSV